MTDAASPKIAQLVADARAELKRLGIDTEGKRSDELLNMAREQRNNPRQSQAGSDRSSINGSVGSPYKPSVHRLSPAYKE
jgi:hypothetical protein